MHQVCHLPRVVAQDDLENKKTSGNGGMTALTVGTGDTWLGRRDDLRIKKSFEDKRGKAFEEERRFTYVGISRAKERLIISNADRREMYNQCQSMYI